MTRLLFTPLAEADLNEILEYIAHDKPIAAKRFVARIRDRCQLIASNPLIGQTRPEFPGNYRSFPVGTYVIFYRVVHDAVEIHRVLHGARDIDSLLG